MRLDFINMHFDCIYILTIERAVERQKHIEQELKGVNYKFILGIDRNNVSIEEIYPTGEIDSSHIGDKFREYSRYFIEPSKKYADGIIACAMGHRLIYQDVIKNKYKRVIIFEDDVVAIEDEIKNLEKSLSKMPPKWDLLYFGYTGGVLENPKRTFLIRRLLFYCKKSIGYYKKFANEKISYPYNKYYDTAGKHAGTYGYAITEETAQKLIQIQTPLVFSADGLLIFFCSELGNHSYVLSNKAFVDATYFNTKVNLPSLLNYR